MTSFFRSGAVHGKALKLEVCNVYDDDFHVEVAVADAGVAFGTRKEGTVGGYRTISEVSCLSSRAVCMGRRVS